VALPSVDGFTISSDEAQRAVQEQALRALYGARKAS
jgi:hypothetical protein